MSSSAPSTTHRRHQQRASAHACPECGADPLIIIFKEPAQNDDAVYWFDCPHCPFTSALRAVPEIVNEAPLSAPLARGRIDEYVATIDIEPPF